MQNGQIDLVLPWVDGSDPLWRAEKNQYDTENRVSDVRYQSWDNLQYIFRGIETYMPWVHKVFFVTWGHRPKWLNTAYEKLEFVKHSDYIPSEYLPTFNSNVIEMNYFRIKNLSENFILFNDDLFPVQPISEEYYFRNNLPCEEAVETHFILEANNSMEYQMIYACANNMVLLNRHFKKREVIRRNPGKWFNLIYGKRLSQNISLLYWRKFESFVYPHEAMPMKKSVLKEIWEKEPETLQRASYNRFRSYTDITQRLITMWQICSGNFVPHKYKGKLFLVNQNNYKVTLEAIKNRSYPILSLNEAGPEGFDVIREAVNQELRNIFPKKSKFEL